MIEIDCPHCNQHIEADDAWAGLTATCPTCLKDFEVPAKDEFRASRVHDQQANRPQKAAVSAGNDSPLLEGSSAAYGTLNELRCPKCQREFGCARSWSKPVRCDCGQLLLRAVAEELSDALGGQDAAWSHYELLKACGWIRGFPNQTLTESGHKTLRDPKIWQGLTKERAFALMQQLSSGWG